jgi:hypothetical protein
MKTRLLSLLAILGGPLLSFGGETPVYEWTHRLELTADQQKLLHLYTRLDGARDDDDRAALAENLQQLITRLGKAAVRPAKPHELTVTRLDETAIFAVHNPSRENVAITISVRGDEQRLGTRMGSMGRLTYLEPSGTLIVPNLYWTTPATK